MEKEGSFICAVKGLEVKNGDLVGGEGGRGAV